MKLIYIFLLTYIIFSSCKDGKKLLPTITGKAGEVVLVADNNIAKSSSGELLKQIFSEEVDALPQSEPIFDLVTIPNKAFTNIFQTHRNIVLCQISDTVKQTSIAFKKDVWANQQVVIIINANNDSSLNKILKINKANLQSFILDAENERILDNYNKYSDREIIKTIADKYNLNIVIPKGYTIDVAKDNFIWISHETPQISQGLLIYSYNYTDTNTFTRDYLINKRNEVLKENVPGPRENSYMTTEMSYNVIFKEFMKDSLYYVKINGLWKVEGDYMGGPFVSISTVDVKRNRVVTAEGFVYAPKYDKRNYLRQLEAMLNTLKIK